MQIWYPPWRYIGEIVTCDFCLTCCRTPGFTIRNRRGAKVMHVSTPCYCEVACQALCGEDTDHPIRDARGKRIGTMRQKWKVRTDDYVGPDRYIAYFPSRLPVSHKVLILCCAIFKDFVQLF